MKMASSFKIFRYLLHISQFQSLHRKHKSLCCKSSLTYSTIKHVSRSTIFALSTPSGVSAIAVIRISGPNASDVLYKMGKFHNLPEPRKAILCRIRNPESEELLDKALVLWFPSPNSFTGEDMCELHTHGGIAVVKSILSSLMKLNHFRMAEPGEFTKRAFLANKLDLTEVEGLANLLHAETEIQQRQALRQMDGMLNKLYSNWSFRIKKCLASVEAYIDFSEDQHLDDTILKSVQKDLEKLKEEISGHISDYRQGERLRNGVNTVLIGQPNVGKSSLLNSLCQRDIAIVSPTAGTTRDIIEASFNLDGYLVNISDTAGIRDTDDSVELEGVKRAKDRSSTADLLLFILEAKTVLEAAATTSIRNENYFIQHLILKELGDYFVQNIKHLLNEDGDSGDNVHPESSNVILLINKVDLLNEEDKQKLINLENSFSSVCGISCTEGTGMSRFLNLFANKVKEMCSSYRGEEPIITQERHRVFLSNSLQSIICYEENLGIDAAIAAEHLRIAMIELGKITGKVRVDDILDVIFKGFCIGK